MITLGDAAPSIPFDRMKALGRIGVAEPDTGQLDLAFDLIEG